ncbi:hypothetical protein A2U01_0087570, partial [Trifolium medium]|nr:hypothetical protein [Trifolium medium]
MGQRILPAMLSRFEYALSELLDPFNKLSSGGQSPDRLRLAPQREPWQTTAYQALPRIFSSPRHDLPPILPVPSLPCQA